MLNWFKTKKLLINQLSELLDSNDALTHALAVVFQELQELRFESVACITAMVAKYGVDGKMEIDHSLTNDLVDGNISINIDTDKTKRTFALAQKSLEQENINTNEE